MLRCATFLLNLFLPFSELSCGTMILSAAVNTLPGWVAGCAKAAPMASILLYLAPLPTTKNIMKEQKVGDLPLLPQTMMLNNAVLWTAYGRLLVVQI